MPSEKQRRNAKLSLAAISLSLATSCASTILSPFRLMTKPGMEAVGEASIPIAKLQCCLKSEGVSESAIRDQALRMAFRLEIASGKREFALKELDWDSKSPIAKALTACKEQLPAAVSEIYTQMSELDKKSGKSELKACTIDIEGTNLFEPVEIRTSGDISLDTKINFRASDCDRRPEPKLAPSLTPATVEPAAEKWAFGTLSAFGQVNGRFFDVSVVDSAPASFGSSLGLSGGLALKLSSRLNWQVVHSGAEFWTAAFLDTPQINALQPFLETRAVYRVPFTEKADLGLTAAAGIAQITSYGAHTVPAFTTQGSGFLEFGISPILKPMRGRMEIELSGISYRVYLNAAPVQSQVQMLFTFRGNFYWALIE